MQTKKERNNLIFEIIFVSLVTLLTLGVNIYSLYISMKMFIRDNDFIMLFVFVLSMATFVFMVTVTRRLLKRLFNQLKQPT